MDASHWIISESACNIDDTVVKHRGVTLLGFDTVSPVWWEVKHSVRSGVERKDKVQKILAAIAVLHDGEKVHDTVSW